MSIERVPFAITTDATAAGSTRSPYPIEGRILEVVSAGSGAAASVFNAGGTATLTATRRGDGGTAFAFTALTAPFQRAIRPLVTSTTGGTAVGYDLTGGVPCADYVTAVVTQGGTSVSGTVFVYYDRDRTP